MPKRNLLILAAPLAVAAYPIVQLGAGNPPEELPVVEFLILLLVSVTGTALLFGILYALLRDQFRAVALTIFFAAAFSILVDS